MNPIDSWGYPAWDGQFAVYFGGYCDDTAINSSVCQEMFISCWYLDWMWMGFIDSACSTLRVTFDGEVVFEHTMTPEDHNYGSFDTAASQWGALDISLWYVETVNLCFEWTACGDDTDGDGFPDESNDRMLIDWVTMVASCVTSTEETSFTTVKTLY